MSNLQKYNPIWLEANNFNDNWHDEQKTFLQNAINNCKESILVVVVTDASVLEAMATVLFAYDFSVANCGNMGCKTISIKVR